MSAIRILVAKPGLDGHDVGAKIVVRAFMEAGFEVIYTGLRQSPEAIAASAAQEDVDVIGLSILSGSHLPLCRKLKPLLKKKGLHDRLWVVGGNIPKKDHAALKKLGVSAVFQTGSDFDEIVAFIKKNTKAAAAR